MKRVCHGWIGVGVLEEPLVNVAGGSRCVAQDQSMCNTAGPGYGMQRPAAMQCERAMLRPPVRMMPASVHPSVSTCLTSVGFFSAETCFCHSRALNRQKLGLNWQVFENAITLIFMLYAGETCDISEAKFIHYLIATLLHNDCQQINIPKNHKNCIVLHSLCIKIYTTKFKVTETGKNLFLLHGF